jgi:hypothetical protein
LPAPKITRHRSPLAQSASSMQMACEPGAHVAAQVVSRVPVVERPAQHTSPDGQLDAPLHVSACPPASAHPPTGVHDRVTPAPPPVPICRQQTWVAGSQEAVPQAMGPGPSLAASAAPELDPLLLPELELLLPLELPELLPPELEPLDDPPELLPELDPPLLLPSPPASTVVTSEGASAETSTGASAPGPGPSTPSSCCVAESPASSPTVPSAALPSSPDEPDEPDDPEDPP